MGRNHLAKAMPFDGKVRQYLIIYYVNLFANKRALTEPVNRLCTRCCTQHLMHTRSGKRHAEPAIGWLCVLRSLDSEMSVNLFANKRALTEPVNILCARCCTQHLTHTCSGKRHVEPAIGWFCVLQSLGSEMSVIVTALTLASQMAGFGRPMCLLLGLIRAVAGQKLDHQFLCAISFSPSLTTPMA